MYPMTHPWDWYSYLHLPYFSIKKQPFMQVNIQPSHGWVMGMFSFLSIWPRPRVQDSHVQATLSVQISGTKRWRLMPLRRRTAPFLAMPLGLDSLRWAPDTAVINGAMGTIEVGF